MPSTNNRCNLAGTLRLKGSGSNSFVRNLIAGVMELHGDGEKAITRKNWEGIEASVGEAVVWESDGVVYTAVTDAPWSDLAGAVRDLPHGDPPGRLRRVAQTVVSLFRWR